MANIDITGADGSLTYTTLVSGTNVPLVGNVVIVRGRIFRRTATTTRPGSLTARKTQGEWNGSGVLRVVSTDDATPPLPTSVQGVLNVFLKSTQKITIPVIVTAIGGIGYTSLQGETPQFWDYEFEVSAISTATTPTIT